MELGKRLKISSSRLSQRQKLGLERTWFNEVKRMDKIEYIPGDLVKFATNTYTIVNFEENFLHNKICYALISTNSTKTAFVADRDILPIPLTPFILEKNGWEHKDDIYFKEFSHRKLVIMDENAYIINECCLMFLCPAKFISQLQHLLFGLGLNSEMEV